MAKKNRDGIDDFINAQKSQLNPCRRIANNEPGPMLEGKENIRRTSEINDILSIIVGEEVS